MGRRLRTWGGVLVVTAALLSPAVAQASDPVLLDVVGTRADLVSGGDVLVRTDGILTVDGVGVPVHEGGLAVVTGLKPGRNLLQSRRGSAVARLVVTDHPAGGPVLSGPQLQPWLCTTEANDLGAPVDAQCSAPTRYSWHYLSAVTRQFRDYDPRRPAPDVATTTTDQGVAVPYIVRRERGTLNRGIYDVAVLADPTRPWTAWAPQRAWNRKLLLVFGPGCAPGHSQATPLDVLRDEALSRGYAVGQATTASMGNVCNTSIAAETVLMLKERVSERYGPVRFTVGEGCSGGSETQNVLADRFPGLLDGVRPTCTFPDNWTPAIQGKSDCDLLQGYFATAALPWTADQRAAVLGSPTEAPCTTLPPGGSLSAEDWDPTTGCGALPPATVWTPSNPGGVRCTLPDLNANAVGLRSDGRAHGVLDDVGVQWGLAAVRSGAISVAQFVDLNAEIGGWTIDHARQAARTTGDLEGIRRMYSTGQLTTGEHLGRLPSIDARTDDTIDLHGNAYRQALRARVRRSVPGTTAQVFWTEPAETPSGVPTPATAARTFVLMDQWLTAVTDDERALSPAEKVLANRPDDARDSCVLAGRLVDDGPCALVRTEQQLPRQVAGGPGAADVLKCRLAPLTRQGLDYTAAQWARMQSSFPDGVCDWSRPGVGQQAPLGTWISLQGAPQALGPAPVAVQTAAGRAPAAPQASDGSPRAAEAGLPATGPRAELPLLAVALLLASQARRRRRTSSANH